MKPRRHLVSLIKTEELNVVSPNDVDALLQPGHILTDIGATDTAVTKFDIHIVSKGDDDFWICCASSRVGARKNACVPLLDMVIRPVEYWRWKCSGLACVGLGLRNNIVALDSGYARCCIAEGLSKLRDGAIRFN